MAEPEERVEDNVETAYERLDWPLGTIGLILAAIFLMLAVSPFVMIAAFPTTPSDVSRTLTVQPPQPRLQTDPSTDLGQFRAAEEKRLNSYYWIDRNKGIVHIPIAQTMRAVVEKGIDGFPREKQ
jgi:hypothetical protein